MSSLLFILTNVNNQGCDYPNYILYYIPNCVLYRLMLFIHIYYKSVIDMACVEEKKIFVLFRDLRNKEKRFFREFFENYDSGRWLA